MYGPRTQAYGETNYLRQTKVLDKTKALYGPLTQAYGETNYPRKKKWFWIEPSYCIVLGLKPMGKPTT